jgi:hypothetical protein
MRESFVPLTVWLRSAAEEPVRVNVASPLPDEEVNAPVDELRARVRRLRAAVLEALDGDVPQRNALERIRSYADELVEP